MAGSVGYTDVFNRAKVFELGVKNGEILPDDILSLESYAELKEKLNEGVQKIRAIPNLIVAENALEEALDDTDFEERINQLYELLESFDTDAEELLINNEIEL